MTEQQTLLETILNLIGRRTEGPHWDFKLQHHDKNANLIHDVLCLANADHTGPRYLIFGVDNQSFALRTIAGTPNRKTQSDIVSLFRDNANKFFESRHPAFYLAELQHDGKSLDVLVIEDKPHKPYYLVQDYRSRETTVRAHHIYTRIGDTNTPLPDTAPPHEIERMWRERFGLDKPPLERAKRYLLTPGTWISMSEDEFLGNTFYHRDFPEFMLKVAEASEVVARHEEWTRGEIRTDNNAAGYYMLYYHQTLLNRTRFVIFDDRKKSMVAPDWEPRGAGRFYFYTADSIAYALQRYWVGQGRDDDSTTLRIRGEGETHTEARALWTKGMRIPVLRPGELEGFLGPKGERPMLHPCTNEIEQYNLFIRNQLDFEEWRDRQAGTQ